MEVVAKARYVRISPKKLRELRELVLGKEVNYAIDILRMYQREGQKFISRQ